LAEEQVAPDQRAIELAPGAIEALVSWIPAAVIMIDSDHQITAANQASGDLFGYGPQELVGRSLGDLVPVAARPFHEIAVAGYLQRPYVRHPGSGLRLTGLRKDGTEFPVDIALNTLRYPSGLRAIAVINEASDRLEMMQADERREHAVDFWSAAVHDLRTPLNSVLGFSELLLSGQRGHLTAEQSVYVDNIHSSGEHMLALISDVLDLQRVESGHMQLLWEQVSVESVINDAATAMLPVVLAKGLQLVRRGDPSISVLADRRRLRQILDNLLSNAVKYTDAGRVHISTERVGERVRITVSDTGFGIAAADLERVFDPFFQGSLALRLPKSGSGLGLALAKRLVEAFRGEISIESVQGSGTTVRVVLPAA
jgi:PAS domain S-box-containing protein